MVDFNDGTTIGKPPQELVALIIIEKLYNFLEADEDYIKKKLGGAAWPTAIPRARLRNLLLICNPMLQRRMEKNAYAKAWKVCTDLSHKATPEEILEVFVLISAQLDALNLTRLDNKPVFNRLRVEEANKAQGYG